MGEFRRHVHVLHVDIGGCEGCAVTVLRALLLIRQGVGLPQGGPLLKAEVHSKYLGNVDLNGEYDMAIVTGSVCLKDEESVRKLRRVREMSRILIALGSCAAVGGVTLFARGGQLPKPEHMVWQPLATVVDIDYAVPGCPPAPAAVKALLDQIVSGKGLFLNIFASAAKARKFSGYDLMDDVVLTGLCVGCGACVLSCPTQALQIIDRRPDLIPEKCIRCGTCYVRCPRATQILLRRFPTRPKSLREVIAG